MNAISLFEPTAAEKEVVVYVARDRVTKFTEKNLETYGRLRSKEANPMVFGSTSPMWGPKKTPWYDTTALVDMSLINYDDKYGTQKARVTTNPERDAIDLDIRRNGFSLAELGIILVRRPDGRYDFVEGRTRFGILLDLGMTNIIAEVMNPTTDDNILIFALKMNNSKKKSGEASFEDNREAILSLVESGAIGKEKDTTAGRALMTDKVNYYLGEMEANLKPSERDRIVADALEGLLGYKTVYTFKSNDEAVERIEEVVGKERIASDRKEGIVYVAVSDYIEKIHNRMINVASEFGRDVKEIRMVIYKGTLDSKNPEKSWKFCVRDFAERFGAYESELSNVRFNGVRVDDSRIKIYAGLPAVVSLDEDYSIDGLYIYP
jgi:hypothetical protein